MTRTLFAASALLLASLGCADPGLHELQQKVDTQDKTIKGLKGDLDELKTQHSFDRSVQQWDKVAYLTPGDQGYSMMKTDYGVITVTLSDVRPYASGSNVTLTFGNVTSATMTDVKATIDWGTVDAKGAPNNDDAKSKEVDFVRPLRAGAWTRLDVVLDGVPTTNLGFVRVHDLTNRGIELAR